MAFLHTVKYQHPVHHAVLVGRRISLVSYRTTVPRTQSTPRITRHTKVLLCLRITTSRLLTLKLKYKVPVQVNE